jgi:hypothetical protein
MTIEVWFALGAGLLLVLSLGGEVLRLVQARGRWALLAAGFEVAAFIAALVALALAIVGADPRSPDNLRLVAWGLAPAILGAHLFLQRLANTQGGRLIARLLALAALLLGILVPTPAGTLLGCPQSGAAFTLQWSLFVLGAGNVIVAGSAGLEMILGAAWSRRRAHYSPLRNRSLHILVAQGTVLALVTLGAGLTVAIGWSWQATGTPTSGDPREIWLAITWLVTATSMLAWQMEKGAAKWAAILAVLAAASAFGSLLVAPALGWSVAL